LPSSAAVAALASAAGAGLAVRHRSQRTKGSGRGSAATRVRAVQTPYPQGVYDPVAAAAYFQTRPLAVVVRSLQLLTELGGFGAKLFIDKQTGSSEANAVTRGGELTGMLTRLGPTFIKIGQAASIRADLLPPAYLVSLQELQDRVPSFPTEKADEIIEAELGLAVGELFVKISEKPIASASLGQVYRATMRDGPEVAVKVQRPGMEDIVALDLYLLRVGADPLQWFLRVTNSGVNSDLVGVIDTWGEGFVGELDYRKEAQNARDFQKAIEETPLRGAVFAPPVIASCSSAKVLTTEWVDGERLELSTAEDVTKLCFVAMTTYLTMLLETGTLHADPHPGNLLRASDGRLCILDWGLVTTLSKDFHVAYIEHIAHLVSGDYEPVPSDLVRLGFVPEGKEQDVINSDVVKVLADVYGQWSGGGGAKAVDIQALFNGIQGLSDRYGNIFRVPPYFFYIARTFVVLEGIGLSNDPNYSVISECLPYVSQRMLSDKDPGIARALRSFVYGAQKDSPTRLLDPERIENLTRGMSSYTSATSGLNVQQNPAKEVARLTDQLSEMLLRDIEEAGLEGSSSSTSPTRRPTPLQDLVLDEVAKVAGAAARRAVWSLPFFREREGPRPRILAPDEQDHKALDTLSRLVEKLSPRAETLLDQLRVLPLQEQQEVAMEVLQRLWQYREDAFRVGGRLMAKLVAQGLRRAQEDLAAAGR